MIQVTGSDLIEKEAITILLRDSIEQNNQYAIPD